MGGWVGAALNKRLLNEENRPGLFGRLGMWLMLNAPGSITTTCLVEVSPTCTWIFHTTCHAC